MKTCAFCGFASENAEEFREHMRDQHGWPGPAGGAGGPGTGEPAAAWGCAFLASAAAILLILLTLSGLASIGYKYAPDRLYRLYGLLILGIAAVVGFDLTIVIGTRARWRYARPVAAILLLIAGVCLVMGATTPY